MKFLSKIYLQKKYLICSTVACFLQRIVIPFWLDFILLNLFVIKKIKIANKNFIVLKLLLKSVHQFVIFKLSNVIISCFNCNKHFEYSLSSSCSFIIKHFSIVPFDRKKSFSFPYTLWTRFFFELVILNVNKFFAFMLIKIKFFPPITRWIQFLPQ